MSLDYLKNKGSMPSASMQLKNEKRSCPGVTGLSEIQRGCWADTGSRAFKSFTAVASRRFPREMKEPQKADSGKDEWSPPNPEEQHSFCGNGLSPSFQMEAPLIS